MSLCFFASDLHGHVDRYRRLLRAIEAEQPDAVLLAGDLLPSQMATAFIPGLRRSGFLDEFLQPAFDRLKASMGDRYPRVLLILGNDDGRSDEETFVSLANRGLWTYLHGCSASLGRFRVYGYSYVPPTPFRLKDWERYDVSRFVDPGCISPEEGWRTVPVAPDEARYATIQDDLRRLVAEDELDDAVFLFHTPPYQTKLDRAALDGKMVDHAPLDVHVGSVAVRRFVEVRQPLLTLHGHVHESPRLTGSWRDRIGRTHMFTGGHCGPELALIRFDLDDLEAATRELV